MLKIIIRKSNIMLLRSMDIEIFPPNVFCIILKNKKNFFYYIFKNYILNLETTF